MPKYECVGRDSSGTGVSDCTDEQNLRQKGAILQHFLCNHIACKITRGAQDCTNWGTALEGCDRLTDGDQPLVNDTLTHNPGCAVLAICGPLTPGGVLGVDVNARGERVTETFDGYALGCLDAGDAEGAAWVRGVLQARGVTVHEQTPTGGHYFFVYRMRDTPGGEELPAGALRAPGSVMLRTRGECVPLSGTTLPNGDVVGPWANNWGFLRVGRDFLESLATRVQSQPSVEAVRQVGPAPAPTTTPKTAPELPLWKRTAEPPWDLIRLGARVFPLKAGTKGEQLLRSWTAEASADPEQVVKWAWKWPGCNWGVACGPLAETSEHSPKQLLVIDCDSLDAYRWFVARYYPKFAHCAAVETGRDGGGAHVYLWAPPECTITTGAHIDLPADAPPGLAIDVRGRGGYVVAPGSVHPSGRRYEWSPGNWHGALFIGYWLLIRDAPAEWFDGRDAKHLLTGMPATATAPAPAAPTTTNTTTTGARLEAVLPHVLEEAVRQVEQACEGQRNDTLSREAYTLCRAHREQGATALPDDSVQALVQAAGACGLPEREARACIQAAERAVFIRGKGDAFTLRERPRAHIRLHW